MPPGGGIVSNLLATNSILLWIALSVAVICSNKYILGPLGFPYPALVTLCQVALFSGIAAAGVLLGWVAPCPEVTRARYVRSILPIGVLFGLGMWAGNAAFVHLSISYVQILKGLMPPCVYCAGVLLKTQELEHKKLVTLSLIPIGIGVATLGEVHASAIGVLFLLLSILFEAFRLHLADIHLRQVGIVLSPITTMYYFGPISLVILGFIVAFYEWNGIMAGPKPDDLGLLLSMNAILALSLNMSLFLLISRATAQRMSTAGLVKDWMLIGVSFLVFQAPLTILNLIGYAITVGGLAIYNQQRMQKMRELKKEALAKQHELEAAEEAVDPDDPEESAALVRRRESEGGAALGMDVGARSKSLANLVQSQHTNPLVVMMSDEEMAAQKSAKVATN